jgi:hypothetical protein
MQTSLRLGLSALALYLLGFAIVFIPRVEAAEPIGVVALVLSAILGRVAVTKGTKSWWSVPAVVVLTFAFGVWLGFTAR